MPHSPSPSNSVKIDPRQFQQTLLGLWGQALDLAPELEEIAHDLHGLADILEVDEDLRQYPPQELLEDWREVNPSLSPEALLTWDQTPDQEQPLSQWKELGEAVLKLVSRNT